jgi:hypothetical protein
MAYVKNPFIWGGAAAALLIIILLARKFVFKKKELDFDD